MRIKQRFNMCNDCQLFSFLYNKNHYKDQLEGIINLWIGHHVVGIRKIKEISV